MVEITASNFEEEVVKSDVPVLVDFWATWCGPCSAFSPILDAYEASSSGKVKLGKVNVDEQMALAQQFRVMSIPTVVLFENGEKKAVSVGALGAAELESWVEKNL